MFQKMKKRKKNGDQQTLSRVPGAKIVKEENYVKHRNPRTRSNNPSRNRFPSKSPQKSPIRSERATTSESVGRKISFFKVVIPHKEAIVDALRRSNSSDLR